MKFGRLTAISASGLSANGRTLWRCICICGNETTTMGKSLLSGNTKSCGCLHSEGIRAIRSTHGMSGSWQISTLKNILNRCENPNTPRFKDYGGRGITVDPRWRADRQSFLDDIATLGPKPPRHSLDRIDNDKGYFIGNLRWATQSVQSLNRRKPNRTKG